MNFERVPILRMGEFLLVTIQGEMHDTMATTLQQELTDKVASTGARGVLLDISGLRIVDSFMGRMVCTIASMTRLMDADTVVVGMQPAVAITLVEMGMTLPGVLTAMNVEKGMELLRNQREFSWEDSDGNELSERKSTGISRS